MTSPRSAAFLRSVAAQLERVAERLDPALDRALRAVYGMDDKIDRCQDIDRMESYADLCERLRLEREAELSAPDPASPGDVWPKESKVTPFVRRLRGVR